MIKGTLLQKIHNQRLGSSASWSNPESGNAGSVKLLQIFARDNRRCERIEYELRPPQPNTRMDHYVLVSCLQADGTWKLS
jgi:hypothetical protein